MVLPRLPVRQQHAVRFGPLWIICAALSWCAEQFFHSNVALQANIYLRSAFLEMIVHAFSSCLFPFTVMRAFWIRSSAHVVKLNGKVASILVASRTIVASKFFHKVLVAKVDVPKSSLRSIIL